jgi:hypothetical protein
VVVEVELVPSVVVAIDVVVVERIVVDVEVETKLDDVVYSA